MVLAELGTRFLELVSAPADQDGLVPALAWRAFIEHAREPVVDLGSPSDDRVMIETGELGFPPYGAPPSTTVTQEPTALYMSFARHVTPADGEARHLTVNLFFAPGTVQMPEFQNLGFSARSEPDRLATWQTKIADSVLSEPLSRESCLLGYWDSGWM